MSQTKFVRYGDDGFWAYDVALSIFLKHLIAAAVARGPDQAWLSDAVEHWRITAFVPDCGLELDDHWSAEQVSAVVELIDQACDRISRRDSIPSAEVESWEGPDGLRLYARGEAAVPTSSVTSLGHAIRDLILATLPPAPPGTHWCYGGQSTPIAIGTRES
jgi:hypothetical protein